jgi:hypothetical protein
VDILFDYIDKQLKSSNGKNLFYSGSPEGLGFVGEIHQAIDLLKNTDILNEEFLADYTTGRVLAIFCQTNQYYSFSKNARDNLKKIYLELIPELRKIQKDDEESLKTLSAEHKEKLAAWLKHYNPDAEKLYPPEQPFIEPVPCSEYSPETQLAIFGIGTETLVSPILDIGCGSQANLVIFLRKKGLDAHGIDRFAPNLPFFEKADWLEYPFGKQKWGSLFSNLGFTNHFRHHHASVGGNYIGYARKYVEILGSLKPGGSFYYAPALPFIEKYLDTTTFKVENYDAGIPGYQTTRITRL